MKLGILTNCLPQQPLAEAAKYFAGLGIQALEIGAGGYPGKCHCDPEVLLADEKKLAEFKAVFADNGLEIAALSCHGNCVHPVDSEAARYQKDYENTLKLAEKLGVKTVVTFSGCPAGSPKGEQPNWVTCPWPEEYLQVLDYQWNDVLIPYWLENAKKAEDAGVRIAIEMHPGFCVYNPESMMKLRKAVGPVMGANLDPSHLFWQGVDPIYAIRYLGKAIHYFHAKDTRVDEMNSKTIGVLDVKHYSDEINRAWVFRAVGYGHDYQTWKDIVSNLRMVGYDGVMSIEHEDSLMTSKEGLEKAVKFLQEVMMFADKGPMTWA